MQKIGVVGSIEQQSELLATQRFECGHQKLLSVQQSVLGSAVQALFREHLKGELDGQFYEM